MRDLSVKLYYCIRYGTVRYGTVRYGKVRYGTVRYGTVRYGTVRYVLALRRTFSVRFRDVRTSTTKIESVTKSCNPEWNPRHITTQQ